MKRGQVWIETVVYTLIGLALIALVLAFVTPKINEYKDKAIIEQTISSLNVIDSKINEVVDGAPLNKRTVDVTLKRGTLYVDAVNNSIYFILPDSHVIYSQPDVETSLGRIKILTKDASKKTHEVSLRLNYDIDLDYDNNQIVRKYNSAATPYKFSFENTGFNNESRQVVFFSEVSGA